MEKNTHTQDYMASHINGTLLWKSWTLVSACTDLCHLRQTSLRYTEP